MAAEEASGFSADHLPQIHYFMSGSGQVHHQHDQKYTKDISSFVWSLLCCQRTCSDHPQQVPTGNNSMVFYKKAREELIEIIGIYMGQ